jgi:glycosyltransferase involved in cell wall biosynthesis
MFLEEAVSAVLGQDGVDPRVIIVDDASPDDSASIARALAAADSRVTVVVHDTNKGHIQTYNDGLALVETEFVTLVSADDLLTPGALRRACALMRSHPSVGLVYGLPLEFSEGRPRPQSTTRVPESWTIWGGREWIGWMARRGRCFILSPEVVMRTSALRQVGNYNAALPHSGDLEYWIRTASRWDIGRINGPAQAYYRVHQNNMHLTTFATMLVDFAGRRDAFNVLQTPEIEHVVADAARLNARARRAIARETLILATRDSHVATSGDNAFDLIEFAENVWSSPQTRRKAEAARRSLTESSQRPRQQRLIGELRRQVDRVRWRAWRMTGIS